MIEVGLNIFQCFQHNTISTFCVLRQILWAIFAMPNILDLSALDMVANNAFRDIAFDNFNLYLNEEALTNDQIKIK